MAYIPSRRIWEEGEYQAGAFDVYGLPASRWCADIEDRIAGAVARLVAQTR
jgi:neutral ceramidase